MKRIQIIAGLVFSFLALPAFCEKPRIIAQTKPDELLKAWVNLSRATDGLGVVPLNHGGPHPVGRDGTQVVRVERGTSKERAVGGHCFCNRYEPVYGRDGRPLVDANGNEVTRCASSTWQSGKVYRDVPITTWRRIVNPEAYAQSEASSASSSVGFGAGLGLGAVAAIVVGVGARYLLRASTKVAGASAAIVGLLAAVGAGMFFGSRAKGPAYERALQRAQSNPDLPPTTRTESTPIRTIDENPPIFGSDCSLIR